MASTAKWTEPGADAPATLSLLEPVSEHAVQFYERDDFLVDALSKFIGAGLGAGEAGVVIATPEHRVELDQRLRARGLDLAAAQARGDYVTLDAAETLVQLQVGGTLDERRFAQVIGGVIKRAADDPHGQRGQRGRSKRHVRAFGEMVALLWAAGDQAGAIRLEELWNALRQRMPAPSFSLLCAYPMPAVAGAANGTLFAEMCARHARVLPDERYSALRSDEERLRAIALLQQRAASLEAEIAERRQTEHLLAEQNAMLERIAAGCPLDECLTELTRAVARLSPPTRAAVLLADATRATVAAVYAAELPRSFAARLAAAPLTDPVGAVIQSGQSVTCADVAQDAHWSPMWREGGLAHGILACYAEPVTGVDGKPLAALLLGFDTPRAPSDWERRIAAFGTHVASIAIERDRAAQALRVSEERLAAIFHSTAVGVAVLTPSMHFLQVNDAFCRIVGYAPEDLTAGMEHTALCHPDDLPTLQEQMAALLAGRIPTFVVEVRCRRQDGALIWVQQSVSLTHGAMGQPLHLVALCQDITERKRAEAASAHLAAIVTSAEDAIASKTLDSIVTSWNASAERMFGYSAAEMIGQPITRLFPPDRLSEEDRIIARIRAGERIEHFETVRMTKDGRQLDVSLTISPIRDGAGTIIGASKIVRDITEQKRLREALRADEETLRTLADNIPTLAWMAHPDGHIFWYNQRWYDYTGMSPASQDGWGWQSAHDPDVLPRVLERWRHSLATGEPFEMLFPLRSADGVFRPFLTRVLPVKDNQGRVVRWFGTNTDVSDLQAAEEALRAANQRMDEFLHTATHELKTPLASLQVNVQLVERRLQRLLAAPPDSGRAVVEALQMPAQLLARNQQQVRRLTRLVDDLVDAARIQAGKLEIRPAPCDLAEIVLEAVTEQRAVQPERAIHLTSAVPEGQPVPVEADADRIGQVLTNYLTNALKYSSEASPVEIALRVEGGVARVSVRDHGPGIPSEEQARVWERGHRVPGIEATGEGVGLGLGLHISREIVEHHGGQVGVESVVGEGSTFWFSLPLSHTL